MVVEATMRMGLDDAMSRMYFTDFSGGINSQKDPQDLGANEAQDAQNVKLSQDGRVIGRDGNLDAITGLPAVPDGGGYFTDSNEARHDILFANGNLYEVTLNVETLVTAGCYTAGNAVAFTTLNGILYFSDGVTIHAGVSGTWEWDPVVGTNTYLVSSGSVGTVPTPAAKVMSTYAGSVLWGDVTFVGGTIEGSAYLFSNVNDPTTVVGTNIQSVGEGVGGHINCIANLAIAEGGISPFKSLYVGKSQMGVYLYSGPLGQQLEALVNVPVGVRDGASFQYVPGPDGHAYALFLGTDFKLWVADGVNSYEISKPIRNELFNVVSTALAGNPAQRFRSCLNDIDFQYILDTGSDVQYIYHYQVKAFTRYSGWRSGWFWQSYTSSGIPKVQCATDARTYTRMNFGASDNGAAINPYWLSGILNDGDDEKEKYFKFIYVNYATDVGDIQITATMNLGQGPQMVKDIPGPAGGVAPVWDVSKWDSGATWGGPQTTGYTPYKQRRRVNSQAAAIYDPQQSYDDLKGYNIQIKLGQTVIGGHFEIRSYALTYLKRGRQRVANL